MTFAATLSVLAASLLGPSVSFAQTHRPACTSAVRADVKRDARNCKDKTRRTGKHHAKRSGTKKTHGASAPATVILEPALCEGGSAPVRSTGGVFSCADGSEPQCDDGATPTGSRNGSTLVCPILIAEEPVAGEARFGEAECEEEGASCTPAELSSGLGEQACEPTAAGSTSFVCEPEA